MSERIHYKNIDELPEIALSVGSTRVLKTGSWRNVKPVIEDKAAPCTKACPIGTKIPQYFYHTIEKDLDKAADILLEKNPFPAITGRVCPAFCQIGCNRKRFDERISIREIERFVGDYILERGYKVKNLPSDTGKSIAVVGSGPAGMAAAYYLRRAGHKVTIYERESLPGGVLRYGIPPYRLPKDILDKEFEMLLNMGIKIETNRELSKDLDLEELRKNFDALFIATGAWIEKKMKIEGEELFLSGVHFLKEFNTGKDISRFKGKKVACIGAGNVAMDVVRTLKRINAKPEILYRRTEAEMPALEEEREKAKKDGIPFHLLVLPIKAKEKNGKTVLTIQRMQLGEPDSSGRRRPVPVEGSEYEEEYDFVIKAIGEESDRKLLPPEYLGEDGWPYADKKTAATKVKGVFAGGDFIQGPSTVVEAESWAQKAAESINRYLKGEDLTIKESVPKTVSYMLIKTDYFKKEKAIHPFELTVEERINSFEEEVKTLSDELAIKEAKRCFSCGYCNSCGNCFVYCPDMAVLWKDSRPLIDYDFCKGCGVCASECPRGIINMV
ncbi:MAG: NAD(P)-binding protein [Candidatus Hydrothermales bacterium]